MFQQHLKYSNYVQPTRIAIHNATRNLSSSSVNYYEINQQLERKVSTGLAEIIQITKELAEKNQELNTANKQLENFAYTVSHDLQEPLRSINLFTQLLEQEYSEKLDEQAKEYMSYIMGSAIRMQTLIRDVLDYSRLGKEQQTYFDIDLNQLIKTVLIDLQGIIQETETEVVIGDLPTVAVNPTEICQLLSNLISNAIKFKGEQKPRIEIESQLQGDYWLFTVRDNGIGIEPQYQERVFEAFKRLHSQEQYSGSGVGLAICQKVIENHQGYIGVKSKLGEGSTFYFTLPKNTVGS